MQTFHTTLLILHFVVIMNCFTVCVMAGDENIMNFIILSWKINKLCNMCATLCCESGELGWHGTAYVYMYVVGTCYVSEPSAWMRQICVGYEPHTLAGHGQWERGCNGAQIQRVSGGKGGGCKHIQTSGHCTASQAPQAEITAASVSPFQTG